VSDPADTDAGGTSAVTDEGAAVADRADGTEAPDDPPDDGGDVQAAKAATNVTPTTTRKNRSLTTRC
jgi:hypothetical protein